MDGPTLLDPDGSAHLCRDYVAWHGPADTRHPDELPWPDRSPRAEVIPDTVLIEFRGVA